MFATADKEKDHSKIDNFFTNPGYLPGFSENYLKTRAIVMHKCFFITKTISKIVHQSRLSPPLYLNKQRSFQANTEQYSKTCFMVHLNKVQFSMHFIVENLLVLIIV